MAAHISMMATQMAAPTALLETAESASQLPLVGGAMTPSFATTC